MAHVPKEVLAKNFQTNMSAFDHIPGEELYIFPAGTNRGFGQIVEWWLTNIHAEPPSPDAMAVQNPQGQVPSPYTYSLSQVNTTPLAGGSVKIADSTVFPVSTGIAVAEVTVQPGAMRSADSFTLPRVNAKRSIIFRELHVSKMALIFTS